MTDAAFNKGFAAYLGGMNAEAVRKSLPKLSKAETTKLVREYSELFSAGCQCVRNMLEDRKTEVDIRDAVDAIDARISAENATTLYAIARTSAWRDVDS